MKEIEVVNRYPDLVRLEIYIGLLDGKVQIEAVVYCGPLSVKLPEEVYVEIVLRRFEIRLTAFEVNQDGCEVIAMTASRHFEIKLPIVEANQTDGNEAVAVADGVSTEIVSSTPNATFSQEGLVLREVFAEELKDLDITKTSHKVRATLEVKGAQDFYLQKAESISENEGSSNKRALLKHTIFHWFVSGLELRLCQGEGKL